MSFHPLLRHVSRPSPFRAKVAIMVLTTSSAPCQWSRSLPAWPSTLPPESTPSRPTLSYNTYVSLSPLLTFHSSVYTNLTHISTTANPSTTSLPANQHHKKSKQPLSLPHLPHPRRLSAPPQLPLVWLSRSAQLASSSTHRQSRPRTVSTPPWTRL